MQIEVTAMGPVVLTGTFEIMIAESLLRHDPRIRTLRDAIIGSMQYLGSVPASEAQPLMISALYAATIELGKLHCPDKNCSVHDHQRPMRDALQELKDSLRTTEEANPDDDKPGN